MTQKEIYNTIIAVMSDNAEVVEFCEKKVAALDKKKAYAPKASTIMTRESVHDYLVSQTEPVTNKTITDALGVTPQAVSAAIRYLISEGKAERIKGEGTKNPDTFKAISE